MASNKDFIKNSHLFGGNTIFVEEMYQKYLADSSSVSDDWKVFFSTLNEDKKSALEFLNAGSWSPRISKIIGTQKTEDLQNTAKEDCKRDYSLGIFRLVEEYRQNGHLLAKLDPLKLEKINQEAEKRLSLESLGIKEEDLDNIVVHKVNIGEKNTKLRNLVGHLRNIYCSATGYEISHIHSLEEREWLYSKVESSTVEFVPDQDKKDSLEYLIELESFEQFLHSRFPGAKRFSIEGGESAILSAYKVIKTAVEETDVKEVIIGMPHRGRLNVLTKLMKKSYTAMLSEFQGNLAHLEDLDISGDVKYHLGKSLDYQFGSKTIHMSLIANPSHLEAVNPVVLGKVRAKQDQFGDKERKTVLGVLFHGDAAFAGQGVVSESLSLGGLEGYTTGGTIHIVVNNQIGFTTSPEKSRIGRYPTEVAKIVQAPIFHVNGDDLEAVLRVSKIAQEYRSKFKKDVVIDIVCYRQYGHNEGDEPMFTQPKMYSIIKNKPTPATIYAEKLVKDNIINSNYLVEKKKEFLDFLDKEFEKSKSYKPEKADWLEGKWKGFTHRKEATVSEMTGITEEMFNKVGQSLCHYPKNFNLNKKIERMLSAKEKMIETGKEIDWATAEALAFGSLLIEGSNIRISGQDSRRGTFSHRHSVFIDQGTENEYSPLKNLDKSQGSFEVIDSNLSEFAVLGFEYGYSIVDPNNLTIWEAQFGDFSNGAQIIIDQFISSAEFKWMRMSGLIMLLPHGYEGQGPEHSSARLERYLQLCAEHNMQVVNCTTPANFFHVLRRQIHRDYRKPLIVMSPKSLLRHKLVVSNKEDFIGENYFKTVIGETEKLVDNNQIQRVILCSGKVYYDLLEQREKNNIKDIAIIRIEQYYPFPYEDLFAELNKYKNAEVVWCQEEPKNMGAWKYIFHYIENVMNRVAGVATRPIYIGRPKAASPAVGYMKLHIVEQQRLINEALKINN